MEFRNISITWNRKTGKEKILGSFEAKIHNAR